MWGLWDLLPTTARNISTATQCSLRSHFVLQPPRGDDGLLSHTLGTVSRGPPCAVERVERSPGRQAGSLRWPMATAVRDLLLPSGASAETAAPGSWLHPLAAEWRLWGSWAACSGAHAGLEHEGIPSPDPALSHQATPPRFSFN